MTTYQILSILGVGTLCSLIISTVFNSVHTAFKKKHLESKEEREARWQKLDEKLDNIQQSTADLKEHITTKTDIALQAILRNKLYEIYDRSIDREYATKDDRDNFINLYDKYHSLGKNGVMDTKKEEFLKLPVRNK